jgi:CarboxypepD_reg-like domain
MGTLSISIPSPCHEKWSNFEPTAKGGFCKSCQKEVTDFTKMTDSEMIAYFKTGVNTCGRFKKDQLKSYQTESWSLWSLLKIPTPLIVLMTMLLSRPAHAQTPTATKTEQRYNAKGDMTTVTKTPTGTIEVHGVIVDDEGQLMPGVNVISKDSAIGAVTDALGQFSLNVPDGSTLVVSFIGYLNKNISATDEYMSIEMELDAVALDEMVIVGGCTSNRLSGFWWRIKNIFQR